jgi:hypothetical protein
MSLKTELQKVSEETMRFLRGKYILDEVGDGKDKLEFCENGETVLTIRIHDDRFDFHIDGKCITVADLDTLEAVNKIIMNKKTPNRKPFLKTHIHISNCGHRCDLCIHYKGETSINAEEHDFIISCHNSVYGEYAWEKNCNGCHFPDCTVDSAHCRKEKGIDKCWSCESYTSCMKTAGWPPEIHTRIITADAVTWAILPYVKGQYGN